MTNKTYDCKYVHEYYYKLSNDPDRLIECYNHESSFLHGSVYDGQLKTVLGRENVQRRLAELDYKDCVVTIQSLGKQKLSGERFMFYVFGNMIRKNSSKSSFSHSLVLWLSFDNEYIIMNDVMISYYFTQHDDIIERLNDYTESRWKNEQWLRCGDDGLCNIRDGCSCSEVNRNSYSIRCGGHGVKSPSALRIFGDSCPPTSHQLYVSNIPSGIKYNDLKKFFEQFGPLFSLRIMKINKNFGFITYADERSAKEVLNNRPISFSVEDGVWLTVKEKKSRSDNYKKLKINLPESHQLFVGDIPDSVTVEDLRSFFGRFGTIVCARILRYSKADVPQTTHGFVTFQTRESANRVLNMAPLWYPDVGGILLYIMEKRIVPKVTIGFENINKRSRIQPGGDHIDHDNEIIDETLIIN
ncbi:uncharacterized protein LOC126897982 [Daktulosphaira vitifoliae]|uniref:uncharacterized protein LOC126897982 n=1 Tax=Daktulosphaira vitifoliae TaxID=58002 RepID=UPI0021A9818C|nr:uncharacterized protein LOC126897982 [Daktulosphaira vitifoliae]